jgi:hypothetical protein
MEMRCLLLTASAVFVLISTTGCRGASSPPSPVETHATTHVAAVAPPEAPAAADPSCARLYEDDEARALVLEAAAVVPKGRFRRKPAVLKQLRVDITRLCNRRSQGFNLGVSESWQISPRYDLTWWAAGPDSFPLDSENATIHHVRIVPQGVVAF